ncbi:hypothetical protein EDB81DRAFT_791982 [Dactylonectria macrodidyma]|uniref:Uncharacterized protein n=1 Tax=Dactylonectria macrodidyma TaxID=307937 RepID=A0A9P9EZG2_9HYPO|nr:hypothetical protein EDB81DRAFT_791982 [Dactylonectria macrodidyma]
MWGAGQKFVFFLPSLPPVMLRPFAETTAVCRVSRWGMLSTLCSVVDVLFVLCSGLVHSATPRPTRGLVLG